MLTINLDDAQLHRLQQTAQQLGVAVEEVVNRSIEEYLARRKRFQEASDYVLQKNAELYRRLAQ
jgi:antitoxin FitA